MQDVWSLIGGWCGTAMVGLDGFGGIPIGLLLAGAVASPAHCVPMCGGFVLGQASDRVARMPLSGMGQCARLRAASLAPYHLGRITTYAILGAIAGAGGAASRALGPSAGVFLILAALVLLAQASGRLGTGFALPLPRGLTGYPLGQALGFLPCGLIYAALAVAAASGSAAYGAVAMACFGLGTVPVLILTAWLGTAASLRLSRVIAKFAPAILLANAAILVVLSVWQIFLYDVRFYTN